MKYKTTRKAIVNGCSNVKCAGYRGMPGERLQGIEEYEHNAQSTGTPERVERLLQEFCKLNGGAV